MLKRNTFRQQIRIFVWVSLCLLALALPLGARGQNQSPLVLVMTADGPISSAMAEYLSRGIRTAEQRGAEVLILELNTPGGGIETMSRMVEEIRASRVPVVVYIAPRGAIAGSAGAVITLAGHASAMAPETVIGAASPVGPQGEDLGETMESKVKNVLKKQVEALAERRGAKAMKLAAQMIETAEAATASEALEIGLIDFIAVDTNDLLRQMDGFTVTLESGERTLHTAGAVPEPLRPTFIEQLLAILTNPNIVLLLLQVGIIAILIEISSPGGWVAGFIGVVCLALGTYGLGVLDVNWFGIIFLISAFVLFVLDIKAPTHGALTAAAVGSLIIGALVLFNSPGTPTFQRVSVPLVVVTSIASGALFFVLIIFAWRAQAIPLRMGQETVVGRVGKVKGKLATRGIVQVGGEQWTAELAAGEEPLADGARVEVIEVRGLKLIVRKAGSQQGGAGNTQT